MAKYIDADKLLKMLEQEKVSPPPRKNSKSNLPYLMGLFESERVFRTCLFLAEREDVAPVVHSRWFPYNKNMLICDNCAHYWIAKGDQYDFKYCPHCGARMDEEVDA